MMECLEKELDLTLPIPLFPKVAEVFEPALDDDDPAGEPRYMSFFFLTSGVAKDVVDNFF